MPLSQDKRMGTVLSTDRKSATSAHKTGIMQRAQEHSEWEEALSGRKQVYGTSQCARTEPPASVNDSCQLTKRKQKETSALRRPKFSALGRAGP